MKTTFKDRSNKVEEVYPITVITYPNGQKSMDLILNEHIKQYTPTEKYRSLMDFLCGQTASLEGVYAGDVQRWLNRNPSKYNGWDTDEL